jgi:glycosyltransferase involved in cell wall biosynthesis
MRRMLHTSARAAALLAALPVLAANALAAAVRPGRTRGEPAAGGGLYVVVPYPPGEKSGGSAAIQGLLTALGEGYAIETIPLYAMDARAGRVRRLLADWLTHALPMAVHCRPFALSGAAVRGGMADGRPVVVEFLSGAQFLLFGRRPANPLVLREHEPLCRRLWSERAVVEGIERPVRALQAALAWLAMAAIYAKVDRVVTLTPDDAAFLRRAFPFFARKVTDIPVSFDVPDELPAPVVDGGGREMLFLANFHHRPNVDGLRWLLREVAPRLGDGWTLHLCGLDEPLNSADLPASGVRLVRHGFVPDVDAAFAHVRIAVAPVISGGGVRMKNLALASLGKAIVTTSRGNEGIGFVDREEAMIADDAAAMAGAILRLHADPGAAARIGALARERVRSGFGHAAVLARWRTEVFGGLGAGKGRMNSLLRCNSHTKSARADWRGWRRKSPPCAPGHPRRSAMQMVPREGPAPSAARGPSPPPSSPLVPRGSRRPLPQTAGEGW